MLIYLKGALDLVADIAIFEIEKTEYDLVFEKEGVRNFNCVQIM